MIKWDLAQVYKDASITANQCDNTTSTNWRKRYDKINRCRKGFWQKSTPIYKSSPESGHRGNIPQNNKGHIWQKHTANIYPLLLLPAKVKASEYTTKLELGFNNNLEHNRIVFLARLLKEGYLLNLDEKSPQS